MPWSLPQSRAAELMDDPGIAAADHLHALSALARINAVSRTTAWLAAGVAALLDERPADAGRPVVVADVACGGGDVTIALARRLRRLAGSGLRVIGVDVAPRAVERARELADRQGVDATFAVRDVLADGCPDCDVTVNSLFLHHLDDDEACGLLVGMARASRRGLVVSDLVRSRIGLGLAVVGTTLLSSSRVARIDGPRSVRAARTPDEYRGLFDRAGLHAATIRRTWPERVVARWRRSDEGASP